MILPILISPRYPLLAYCHDYMSQDITSQGAGYRPDQETCWTQTF